MTDLLGGDQTRTSSQVMPPPTPVATRTIDDIVQDVGHWRNVTRLLGQGFGDLHHRTAEQQLAAGTHQAAALGAVVLLDRLSDAGFSWRDIARMAGVSVPAVRRWRQGDPPTAEHLQAIARLVAFIDIAVRDHLAVNVVPWMEVPLFAPCPITGIDLAVGGRFDDLFDLVSQNATPEVVLDRVAPNWREEARSEFEVFEATDGELGIRPVREGPD